MYYFSDTTIMTAFDNIKGNLENKFFGILGILKCIETDKILSDTTYKFIDGELSEWLDNVFYLSSFTGSYGQSDIFVKFSNKWNDYIRDTFIKTKINIYDVIVFVCKFESFEKEMSNNDLLSLFVKRFHLSNETIDQWFITKPINIRYQKDKETDSKQRIIFKSKIAISNDTISMDVPYSLSARAGELSRAPFFQTLYAGMDSIRCLLILKDNIDDFYGGKIKKTKSKKIEVLQQIIYGAPGTGKSHRIKEFIANSPHFRTTFHPDSDYSSFVGAYKPTMAKVDVRDVTGKVIIENGEKVKEDKIVYKYVAQSFLESYVAAWKNYPQRQYLIIEEINRGNCAQIFGDLFQLLDRNGSGFSDYPIQADNDIRQYLHSQFSGSELSETDKDAINAIYSEEYDNVVDMIMDGEVLLLPSNLSIWATMNTSDQSLFPIDSAFKRRWDWKYIPISKANERWAILANDNKYDWWSFIEKINDKIGSTTDSEDKKLGYFFIKAEDGQIITADKFVSKVIFYLWNDVFKDYGFDDVIFKDGEEILIFQKFYNPNGTANEKVVQLFLDNLEVEKVKMPIINANDDEEDGDSNSENNSGRDYIKYSINNANRFGKNKLAAECVKEYVKLHPNVSETDILKEWQSLGSIVPHFIESREQFDSRTDSSKRSCKIKLSDGVVYVATNGYDSNGQAQVLADAINQKDWGLKIDIVNS